MPKKNVTETESDYIPDIAKRIVSKDGKLSLKDVLAGTAGIGIITYALMQLGAGDRLIDASKRLFPKVRRTNHS